MKIFTAIFLSLFSVFTLASDLDCILDFMPGEIIEVKSTEEYITHLKNGFESLNYQIVDFSKVKGKKDFSSSIPQLVRSIEMFPPSDQALIRDLLKKAKSEKSLEEAKKNGSLGRYLSEGPAYPKITKEIKTIEYAVIKARLKNDKEILEFYTSYKVSSLNGSDYAEALERLDQKSELFAKLSVKKLHLWHTHPEPGPLSKSDFRQFKKLQEYFYEGIDVQLHAVIEVNGRPFVFTFVY